MRRCMKRCENVLLAARQTATRFWAAPAVIFCCRSFWSSPKSHWNSLSLLDKKYSSMLLLSTFTSVCFFKSRAEYMASLNQLNSGLYFGKCWIIPSDVHSSRGTFFFGQHFSISIFYFSCACCICFAVSCILFWFAHRVPPAAVQSSVQHPREEQPAVRRHVHQPKHLNQ